MLPKTRVMAWCTALMLLAQFSYPDLLKAQSEKNAVITLSYFGEYLGHPGFKAGFEKPLWGAYRPGKRHGQLLAAANLGGYYHKGNHTGLFTSGDLGYRFTTRGGFKLETFLGAGYHRSFVDGPVFAVSPDAGVQQKRLVGQHTLLISWSIGVGKALKNSPISWHIRPGVMVRTPHNSTVLPHIFVETGINYRLF